VGGLMVTSYKLLVTGYEWARSAKKQKPSLDH
jgi:hypothetical protein